MIGRIAIVFAVAAASAFTHAAEAQQTTNVARIGYLSASTPERDAVLLAAFRDGLEALGHTVGRTVVIEKRFANGNYGRLPALAAELLRLKVDVIVGSGPVPAVARKATRTIPIVMRTSNPVGTGLAKSLAHPGGNVTGLATFSASLVAKRLELLKEAVPTLARVAVLHRNAGSHPKQLAALRRAAPALGVTLFPVVINAKAPGDIERVLSVIERERPDGFIVLAASIFETHRRRILDFAARARLPAIYAYENWPKTGGLMSYGTDVPALYRRMAAYVDKVLKGADPAGLPIERPSEFTLAINLKTAAALGIMMPRSILLRADSVVE